MLIANPHSVSEPTPELLSKTKAFFRSLAAMGYVAVNVGSHELAVGAGDLRKAARANGLKLLSANIVDDATSKPAFTATLVRTAGGLKIGMFGLVSESPPSYGPLFVSKGLRVISLLTAARRAVAALRGQGCDIVIALSQLKRHEVDDLGEKVKGLDLVLGSDAMELTQNLQRVGSCLFGDAYMKGKYLGELLLLPGSKPGAWTVANMRQTMDSERSSLAQQVQSMQAELDSAALPDSPLNLTEESRKIMQSRLARSRASLQRLTMELDSAAPDTTGAGVIALAMHPLGKDVADQAKVLAFVNAHKRKFPTPAGPGHAGQGH